MPMFDIPLWQLFLQAASTLVLLTVLGSVLAVFLRLLGDKGPSYDGRQSPNPAVQVPLWAVITGAVVRIGAPKPLDVAPNALKGGAVGLIGAVLASLLCLVLIGNLALALGPKMVSLFQPPFGLQLSLFLATFGQMAVLLAAVNLLPLPPFAMGHVVKAFAPKAYSALLSKGWLIGLGFGLLFYALGRLGLPQELHRSVASALLWGRSIL